MLYPLTLQHENSVSSVSEQHSDLERLKEILFEITECKDDSQQRGWAVHDDEKAISDLLEELLQILVRDVGRGCGYWLGEVVTGSYGGVWGVVRGVVT